MSLFRATRAGLRRLLRPSAAAEDLDDEVRDYLASATEEYLRTGLTADEAARRARADMGSRDAVKDEVRQGVWEGVLETLWRDVRLGLRSLRRTPVFAAVACLTLAVGIGATTAIFSAVSPILFEPLPYPDAGRILAISDLSDEGRRVPVTYGTYAELAVRSHAFAALGVSDEWQPVLTGSAEPERLRGERVSAGYLRAFGISPIIGRDFEDADTGLDAPRVALVSERLVARRFSGDRGIVGRDINLNGSTYLVIGILPARFTNVLAPAAEVWAPIKYRSPAPLQGPEWGHHMRMVARLRPDVSVDQAKRDVDAIAYAPVGAFARPVWAGLQHGLLLSPLQEDVTLGARPALLAILGAVVLVLAIACVNVTNLLLARGAGRRGEFAVRAALGAGRSRLTRQLLTESLVLALLGGALGLLVAEAGVRALVALSPPDLPRLESVHMSGRVFVFALGVTALVGLAVGLVPSVDAFGDGLVVGLHDTSRRSTSGRRLVRNGLVVAEAALALVLLVGAGLLWRSVSRLLSVSPGFDAAHVLTLQVQIVGNTFSDDRVRQQFFEQALDAVRAVPGVSAAAFTSQLPLSGDLDGYGATFESGHPDSIGDDGSALRYLVTPDYFRTMGVPLRQGRLLDAHDVRGASEAILINESYARRKFGDRNPIGQRVRFGPEMGDAKRPWDTIVGVVGDVKQTSLALGEPDAFYVSVGQWSWVDAVQSLVVRTAGDAGALVPDVKRAVWSVERRQAAIERIVTMDDLVARSEAERRFVLTVFGAFAMVALTLAAIGLYGVMAGSVAERTREIGVRSALGASRGEIVVLVIRQGLSLIAFGTVVGLVVSAIAGRAIATLLFGVTQLDPVTYLSVIVILVGVSAVACSLPAWRAARIDPMIALRAE